MSNIPINESRKWPITKEEYYRRRQIQRRREMARKKRKRRNLLFSVCAAVLLALIIGIILLCKSCSSNIPAEVPDAASDSKSDSSIIGSYILSDNSCTYTFKENGSGYLKLPGGSQYNFTFSLADKTLKIDFENAAVSDSSYTVVFNDGGLTLTAVEGTIKPVHTEQDAVMQT